jgi:hypothetical protein
MPAASGFTVDTATGLQVAQRAVQRVGIMQDLVRQCVNHMTDLGAVSQGQWSTRVQALFADYHTTANQLYQQLGLAGSNIHTNMQNYLGADASSAPKV